MKLKPYNMKNKTDIKRWFREMKGYFRVGQFLDAGTDFEGRRYAMDGFIELESILTSDAPPDEPTGKVCETSEGE